MAEKSFKKQLPQNLIMNIASFMISILIGLWLIPYLISHIGKAAYGLIPLAMVFSEYINVITKSIYDSIARFLTIDIQSNNWDKANRTFNTALITLLALVLIQIPLLSYIVFDLKKIINIPYELSKDAYYLFAFTFTGFLISIFSSVFSTSMYAKNRLDLIRMIDLIRILVRVIIIITFFLILKPSLKIVGIANFISASSVWVISIIYWKKLTPNLIIKPFLFDKIVFKKITKMGGWLIINQIGYLLFLKIDLLVINRFIGPEVGGEYAAVQKWNNLIRILASVLSSVIGPMILISYANKKIYDVIKFGKLGVKFLSLFIGAFTGIICGFSYQLLAIWLGNDYAKFSGLLIIMLAHLPLNTGVLPLFSINIALNKVKIPGIITLIMGGLNYFLAIIFVSKMNLGMIGVASAGAIVLTLKNAIFTPLYTASIIKINKLSFYKPLMEGFIVFFVSYLFCRLAASYYNISSWLELISFSFLIFVVIAIIAWLVILDKGNKKMLIEFLPIKFKKV